MCIKTRTSSFLKCKLFHSMLELFFCSGDKYATVSDLTQKNWHILSLLRLPCLFIETGSRCVAQAELQLASLTYFSLLGTVIPSVWHQLACFVPDCSALFSQTFSCVLGQRFLDSLIASDPSREHFVPCYK